MTAQEEVLGLDRLGRTEQQHDPAQGVFDQAQCNLEEGDHAFIVPQRSALSPPREHGRGGRHFCGGQGDSLWLSFPLLQENSLVGGLQGRSAQGRRIRTRTVGSIDRGVALNRALWVLAEEMKKLKA